MHSRTLSILLLVLPALGLAAQPDGAQPPAGSLEGLSLEQLLDLRTAVATHTARPLRAVPGVVTVVTREEILASGARDLIDVLQGVQGIHFGLDNENMVGIGVRGLWAQEGKALLLLDGQPMNEPFYDCLGLGLHYPVDQLERVEVIRGPGSVTYGGRAELAVINLVTRSAVSIGGTYARAAWGQYPSTWGRRTLSAQVGEQLLGDELRVGASLYLGQGRRSDGRYIDYEGQTFPMANGARLDPLMVNVAAEVQRFSLRFIYDGYRVGARDGVGSVVPPVKVGMRGLWLEAKADLRLAADLQLTPTVQLSRQYPWQVTDSTSPMYLNGHEDRAQLGLLLSWKILPSLELDGGTEGAFHSDRAVNLTGGEGLEVKTDSGRFQTGAVYAELLYDGQPFNFSAGARYEYHSEVSGSFVPRLAVTRAFGPAHVKLLYAQAYRTPGFGNMVLSGGTISPERTEVLEAELGWKFGEAFYAAANVFDITLHDPIVFTSDPATFVDQYRNGPRMGSRGIELDARLDLGATNWRLGWSYYDASGKNRVEIYAVPGHPALTRAFPQHKVTVAGTVDLGPVRLGPSVLLTSDRYAELRTDGEGGGLIGNDGALVLVDLEATWRSLLVRGLDLGVGVHNLLNSRNRVLHPYIDHPPMPGSPREVSLTLTWQEPAP